MNDTISMEMLARFAILPGASSLVEAFCDIPPGPMRDAVIHLAQTTAATYRGQGSSKPSYAPIPGVNRPAMPQLDTRTGRQPPTGDKQTEAVRLRMAGKTVNEIMDETGLSKQDIYQATYMARKAGIKVPSTRGAGIKPGTKVWHTKVEDLSGQGLRMVSVAAQTRGITPQAYLDRRALALKLAMEGASYETICRACGETESKVVSGWLSAARAAGHKVPYVVATTLDPLAVSVETAERFRGALG